MTKAHAKPKTAQARPGATFNAAPMPSEPVDEAMQRQNVCDFIRAMSAELSVLAHKNGLEALAMLFENARQFAEAEGRRQTY